MNDQDNDIIWRGVDRQIDQLDETVATRLSQRPHALPLDASPTRTQARSVFPIGLALAIALVAVIAGGVFTARPVDTVVPATGSPHPPPSSSAPLATPAATTSLEVVTGEGDGDYLITRRMGWTCRVGMDATRVLPDLAAVDRAVDEQTVTEGWVNLTLFRQPARVWIGDDVTAAALAHGARLLATGTRGDHWILVERGGRDLAVHLAPHRTPAGRTAWLEGNNTGPCAETDSADALPIDPAIRPVSISKANAEEQRAIDLCISFGFTVDDVAGMGKVPRARDAYKYVPLTGREPDLKNDRPVWIVAYQGMLPLSRRGELVLDPICLLTEREPGPILLLPWGSVDDSTNLEHLEREYRLPPLLP